MQVHVFPESALQENSGTACPPGAFLKAVGMNFSSPRYQQPYLMTGRVVRAEGGKGLVLVKSGRLFLLFLLKKKEKKLLQSCNFSHVAEEKDAQPFV